MSDRIERELELEAPAEAVWAAVIADGWLAEKVRLDLAPGGDARFFTAGRERRGWIEDVRAPAAGRGDSGRLIFWWAAAEEPATRVELTIDTVRPPGSAAPAAASRRVRIRIVETRPLELLDLIATPLPRTGGQTHYGPALVAA
jgi:hypothetical protein